MPGRVLGVACGCASKTVYWSTAHVMARVPHAGACSGMQQAAAWRMLRSVRAAPHAPHGKD